MNVGLGKDPEDTDVSALAIDPQTPATVYAGTYYHGVFKSTDQGPQLASGQRRSSARAGIRACARDRPAENGDRLRTNRPRLP